MDEPKDRPTLHLHAPTTPEGFAVQRAAARVLEMLIADGFAMNQILSVLVSSVWIIGNTAIEAGMEIDERKRLVAAMHSLADLLESAALRRAGGLS